MPGSSAVIRRSDYPLWGRQSRFDDDKYVRFDLAGPLRTEDDDPASYIRRRRGTQNALATGQQTDCHRWFQAQRPHGKPAGTLASGPVATPRPGPDAVAIADNSVVMHGVLAAGTRSGSVSR